MRFAASLVVASTSITSVSALAIPRPQIHDNVLSYRALPSCVGEVLAADHRPSPTDAKKRDTICIRDTNFRKYSSLWTYSPPIPKEKLPYGIKTPQSHDEYLPPGPGPHTQEEIDAASHYTSYEEAVADMEDRRSTPADETTRSQLFSRSADSNEAEKEKKHHLHSHEDYLEELHRTYRLHGHDEYLEGSGTDAVEISAPIAGNKKVQRRCVWGKNCNEICAKGGFGSLISCTWNCGGDANMPTCPK